MTMTGLDCPLCDWTIEIPAPTPGAAANVAVAMGIPADAFISIRDHQAKVRLEHDLEAHLRTHGPTDWLPALLEARRLVWPS